MEWLITEEAAIGSTTITYNIHIILNETQKNKDFLIFQLTTAATNGLIMEAT